MRRTLLALAAALLLLPAFAPPTAAVPSLPATCVIGDQPLLDVSTGAGVGGAIPPGNADPEWEVEGPSGGGFAPAFTVVPLATWAPPPPGTRWLNPSQLLATTPGGNPALLPGLYTYRFLFDLDLVAYAAPELTLQHASDDALIFVLNGQAISSASAALPPGSSFSSFQYRPTGGPGAFVPGQNVLEARVSNVGAHTGLLVSGTLRARCVAIPEPPCANGASTWTIDVTTGRDLAIPGAIQTGDDDVGWRVIRTPHTSAYHQPARAVDRHTSWAAEPFWGRWVNPWPAVVPNLGAGGNPQASAGFYLYAIEIPIAATMLSNVVLEIAVAADNEYVAYVNQPGQVVGQRPSNAFGARMLHTYGPANPGHFAVGTNTLFVEVRNFGSGGSWTGLLVEGRVRGDCVSIGTCTFDEVVSTGVDPSGTNVLPPTAPDPRWDIASPPGGGGPWPAFVINPMSHWVTLAGSAWISPTSTGGGGTPPLGTYAWASAFTAPCVPSNCAAVALDLQFAADEGGDLLLNGNVVSANAVPMWTNTVSVRGCQSFQGTNILEALVLNDGFETGILVEGRYHYP